MPKRHGKAMRQLLETIAEMQQFGLAVDEQARLGTALRKAIREHQPMALRCREQRQPLSSRTRLRSVHRKKVEVPMIQNVSAMSGVAPSTVRQFSDLSAPENAQHFTAEAAHKASGHLRDEA